MSEPASPSRYPPASQGAYAVVVMTLAMVFAFIDRQIPAMLVEPIKADLDLSDTQIALMGGVAFSVFYAIMAMPIGFAVDRWSRRGVLGSGILIWSVMTALAGFANSFAKLFGARVGVAIGEAVIAPVSVSLVSDYYPPEKQGRPLGIISAGVYIGMGGALLAGGFLIEYFTQTGGLTLPLLGYFKPWQATFLMVGIPGIAVAVAAYLIREPVRIGLAPSPEPAAAATNSPGSASILAHVKRFRRTFVPMFGGIVFMGMMTYSFTLWGPTMMVRTHDLPLSEVGLVLGLITIVASTIGTIAAGVAVDWFRDRGYSDAPVRTGLVAAVAALPFGIAAPLVDSTLVAWICIGGLMLLISGLTPLALLMVGGASTALTRGRLTAVYALVMMVFAMSIGPQMTAAFTDFLFDDPARLNWSVSLTAAIVLPAAALMFLIALPRYRQTVSELS